MRIMGKEFGKKKEDKWTQKRLASRLAKQEAEEKVNEELEAEAKAALEEQEKAAAAEKKQQAQAQAQIQAQNDMCVAIKAFVEMSNKFLSELGKKAGVELPGINSVEIKDEPKADTEIKDEPKADTEIKDEPKADTEIKDEPKADTEPKVDTEAKDEPKADAEAKDEPKADTEAKDEAISTDVAQAKADADAAAKSETKPNAKIKAKAKSKAKRGLAIGEDYLVKDLETGKYISKKTWEEAQATSAADAYRIKVWKRGDGSIERPLDVQEILEHFSRSKYSGKRKAFVFFDEGGILRVIPYEEIYAALQAVNFTESFLTKRLVEYDEKGEFVRFADIPAPPATT